MSYTDPIFPPAPGPGAGGTPPVADAPGELQRKGAIGAIVGAGLLALGTLLPWAEVDAGAFSASVNGLDAEGDGAVLLIGALIVAALGIAALQRTVDRKRANAFGIATAVLGGLAFVLVIFDIRDVRRAGDFSGAGFGVSTGIGLYLCLLASLVVAGAGALLAGLGSRGATPAVAPPPPPAPGSTGQGL